MATLNQKCVMNKVLKCLENREKINIGKILMECGYSPKTARGNPKKIITSKGFQEFLAQIDDTKIVEKWYKWALEEKDKRASLEAGDKILKLKDRYPATKFKITAFEEREKVIE